MGGGDVYKKFFVMYEMNFTVEILSYNIYIGIWGRERMVSVV